MSEFDTTPDHDQQLGAAQYLDNNADGVADAIAVPNVDGTTDVFTDQDQNGIHEGAVRFRADGTVAVAFHDINQDGFHDVGVVDQTGNGVPDTTVVDANGDGVLDTVVADLNENGIADAAEVPATPVAGAGTPLVGGTEPLVTRPVPAGTPGRAVIGPVTNPDPIYSLIVSLAEETGQVAYPPDDSDHDGWDDNVDHHPGDPRRH